MTTTPLSESPAQTAAPARILAPFWFAVAIIAAWIGSVALLAFMTANPVTLNRQQILDSEFIAVGTRVTDSPYIIQPVEDGRWPFENRDPIGVANLPETGAKNGVVYLFPLSKHLGADPLQHGDYFVTPTPASNAEIPLIYPVTGDSLNQLEKILSEKAPEKSN